MGLQASKKDRAELMGFLDKLAYRYAEETNNEAYKFFLGKQ